MEQKSALDEILELVFTAYYEINQPRMDGSGIRNAKEALERMKNIRMFAAGELAALRDTAYRYESCNK